MHLNKDLNAGYEDFHEEYYHKPEHISSHPKHNFNDAVQYNPTREIGLKDITDIALTTLAFLSFGMFILQVLMCITMVINIPVI